MVIATYSLQADRNGDGTYGTTLTAVGPSGDAGETLVTGRRGREEVGALKPPRAGEIGFLLDNGPQGGDGAYSVGGASEITAGTRLRLRATYSATTYSLLKMIARRPKQQPGAGLRPLVEVDGNGTLSRLTGKTVTTQLYQSITTDVAIGHLLDAAGWPAGERSLDTGKTTLEWWWADGADAWTEILRILNTEGPGAVIYEDGDGNFVFKNRHHRVTNAASIAVQTAFASAAGGIEPLLDGLQYDDGIDGVINDVTFTIRKRAAQSLAAIWSLGEDVTLAPGDTKKFFVQDSVNALSGGRTGDPFKGAVAPVLTTDYTLSAGSLTTVSLDVLSGVTALLTLTAGSSGATVSGPSGAESDGITVRAQAVRVTNETAIGSTIDTSASQASYGKRSYTAEIVPEIATNVAQDFADAIAGWYQDGRPRVTAKVLASGADARMIAALARDISDRISVDQSKIGLSAVEFWIDTIEHEIVSPAQHMTTFGCEGATSTTYFVLDTSSLDGVDVLSW